MAKKPKLEAYLVAEIGRFTPTEESYQDEGGYWRHRWRCHENKNFKKTYVIGPDGKPTDLIWLPDPKGCVVSRKIIKEAQHRCWSYGLGYRPKPDKPWVLFDVAQPKDIASSLSLLRAQQGFREDYLHGAAASEAAARRSLWGLVDLIPIPYIRMLAGMGVGWKSCLKLQSPLVRRAMKFRQAGPKGPAWRRLTPSQAMAPGRYASSSTPKASAPKGPPVKLRKGETLKAAIKRVMATSWLELDKETPTGFSFSTSSATAVDVNHAREMAKAVDELGLAALGYPLTTKVKTRADTPTGDRTALEIGWRKATRKIAPKAEAKRVAAPKAPAKVPAKRGTAANGNGCTRLTRQQYDAGWRIYYHDLVVLGAKKLTWRRECFRSKQPVRYVVEGIKPGGFLLRALKWFRTAKEAEQYSGDVRRYQDRDGDGFRLVKLRPAKELPAGEQVRGLKPTTKAKPKRKKKKRKKTAQLGLF